MMEHGKERNFCGTLVKLDLLDENGASGLGCCPVKARSVSDWQFGTEEWPVWQVLFRMPESQLGFAAS